MTDHIATSINSGVMIIRMNRPDKKNALTGDMYAKMAASLEEAYLHDDVNSILILGGEGAFTAGNDIADFLAVAMTGGECRGQFVVSPRQSSGRPVTVDRPSGDSLRLRTLRDHRRAACGCRSW